MYDKASASTLPPELIAKIFEALPCFQDVFNFASTSRRLRVVWSENATSIYKKVVRKSIPCHRHARRLLADQGGPPVDSPRLTTLEVLKIAHNAAVVDKAMAKFENDIVCHVSCTFEALFNWYTGDVQADRLTNVLVPYSAEPYYGPGATGHPPTLTRTERPRCIRLYYQLWSLTRLCASEQVLRLKGTTLKRLFQLFEMSMLDENIGCEEDEDETLRWTRRQELQDQIRERIDQIAESVQHRVEHIISYGQTEGFSFYVSMWDHWKPALFEVCCGWKRLQRKASDPEFERRVLWDDSSDEDATDT
jgi:hypothetical protein